MLYIHERKVKVVYAYPLKINKNGITPTLKILFSKCISSTAFILCSFLICTSESNGTRSSALWGSFDLHRHKGQFYRENIHMIPEIKNEFRGNAYFHFCIQICIFRRIFISIENYVIQNYLHKDR